MFLRVLPIHDKHRWESMYDSLSILDAVTNVLFPHPS
jgi:hypothetical protein